MGTLTAAFVVGARLIARVCGEGEGGNGRRESNREEGRRGTEGTRGEGGVFMAKARKDAEVITLLSTYSTVASERA